MITYKVEEVTPNRAEEWLKAATMVNRPLSWKMVHRFRDDMLANRWLLNGESIKFNGAGGLVDGFTRLAAVRESGKTIKTMVVRGLDAASVPTIDGGRSRSLPHVLHMNGFKNENVLAGAVRLVQSYEAGSSAWMSRGNNLESSAVLLDFLNEHRVLVDCLDIGTNIGKLFKKSFTTARATALYYILCKKDKGDADVFFECLITGEMVYPDSPILVLREKLLKETMSNYYPDEREMFALVVKAWNAFRTKQKINILRFGPKEKFPEIL